MKIIITGQPKSGKSTLLGSLISNEKEKYGFLTKEIIQGGHRIGFRVHESSGRTMVLAQTKMQSRYRVGKYFVDVDGFDEYINSVESIEFDGLYYVDEIGQMQLYSDKFVSLVDKYIRSSNDFIGTMTSIFNDGFTNKISKSDNILFFNISESTKSDVQESVSFALKNRNEFNRLPAHVQEKVTTMANEYLISGYFDSFNKLFNNAIYYFNDEKINKIDKNVFIVKGRHKSHKVRRTKNKWMCDCPLYFGNSPFKEKSECSHIQSAILFDL